MVKKDKLFQVVRNRPASVRWEELEALILAFGGSLRANANHSHYVVSFPGSGLVTLARPHGSRSGNSVRPVYVRRIIEMIEEQE